MNLNNLGNGRKLINTIINQGGIKIMGWTPKQQQAIIAKQKNPHTVKSRKP